MQTIRLHPMDPRFAGVTGMGRLERIYAQEARNAFGAMVLLAAGLTVLIVVEKLYQRMTPAGLLLVLLVPGAFMAMRWNRWRRTQTAVAIFEGGFAIHDGRGLSVYRWKDVRKLESFEVFSSGGYYHDVVAHGERIKLPWNLVDIEELWARIKQRTGVEEKVIGIFRADSGRKALR